MTGRRALVYVAVATVAFLAALAPISDGDIYWHLAAGRWMWRAHALVRTDPFTISAAGRPWVDVHWLFQLGVAAAERGLGLVGLTVLKACVVAGAAVIFTRTAERSGGATAGLLCASLLGAGLFAARHLLPLRPVIVTVLFLALTLHTLEGWRTGASPRASTRVMLLPLLQLAWVNCQGLAPLGPGLMVAYLVGALVVRPRESRPPLRPLALALGLALLASFATPYGLSAAALPVRLLARLVPGHANVFSATVAENVPPFVLARTAPEQTAHFMGALAVIGLLLALLRPRIPLAHLLVLLGFLGLALIANRNILLLYVVAPPLLGPALASRRAWSRAALAAPLQALRARRRWVAPLASVAPRWLSRALVAALAVEVGLAGVALGRDAPPGHPTPFRFPIESTRRLAALDAAGPVFAPDHQGGFLTFALPAVHPYIDTRLILHTGAEYAAFLSALDDPARFDALDAQEHFRYVVLTTSNPDRYLSLAAHLVADPAWSLIYTDGSELLFARAGAAPPISLADATTIDRLRADLDARFGAGTNVGQTATLNLARLLIVAGAPQQAERVLNGLASAAAATLRARARFVAGDRRGAEALARLRLASGDEADAADLELLGEIAWAEGRLDEVRAYMRQALAADPYRPGARSLLERLAAEQR
ncbi:MAG TPA: hypothetical protein VHU40_14285 [Polyangia bacterium]|nr:hypothetical protein [Polyangia bacterium]